MDSRTRAFSRRRVSLKAGIGLLSRGAQALMLAVALKRLTPNAASDLSVILAVSTALNLFSNVGIPTLMVRAGREGRGQAYRASLAQGYIVLTLLAGMSAAAAVAVLTRSALLGVVSAVLCVAQSVFYGLEFWSLGTSNLAYDRYLVRSASLQALLALGAPVSIILWRDLVVALVVLASSYVVGTLVGVLYCTPQIVLNARIATIRQWWRDAITIGGGTMGFALLYSADAVILKLTASDDEVAGYRLAVLVVGFLVSVIPINIFLLADAAAGYTIRYRRLTALGTASSAGCAVIAVALGFMGESFAVAQLALFCLIPVSFVRLLTQALIAELNGRGRHRIIAGTAAAGVLLWLPFVGVFEDHGVEVWIFAVVQAAIESVVLLSLAFGRARAPEVQCKTAKSLG